MKHPPPPPPPPPPPLLLSKVALTFRAWVIVTVQGPVPLHPSPPQRVKVEPVAAMAVRVTLALESKAALQVAPQSMPGGVEVTEPLPVPALVTARGEA